MAMTMGRTSFYDNDFYLSSTHPVALSSTLLSDKQITHRIMMHVLIQCPRLVVLIRHSTLNPRDVLTLASAISLAENLWKLTQTSQFTDLVHPSTVDVDEPVDDTIVDILSYGLCFNSSKSMVFCTRFWYLQVLLCGMIDTLYRHFPEECSLSFLPDAGTLHRLDTVAATQLGRVMLGLNEIASPLILVRLQGLLAASIGSWHRNIRYLSSYLPTFQALQSGASDDITDIVKARRMKRWLFSRCDRIQTRLGISTIDEKAWLEALDYMAGEEMPNWIPTKVSFGSKDGELVMELEYDDRTATPQNRISSSNYGPQVFSIRAPGKFGLQHLRDRMKKNGFIFK